MVKLYFYSLPASTLNSSLFYLTNIISLFIRENLVKYFHRKYLHGMVLYQITNLDKRVLDPGQIMASDVTKWSISIANLYSNLSKPMFDIIIFTRSLAQTMGLGAPFVVLGWYFFCSLIMNKTTPYLSHQVAMQQSMILNYTY